MLYPDLIHGALEAAPDAILISDSMGRIAFANRRVCELFGYEPHELLGQPISKLLPDPASARAEVHLVHRNGRDIPVDVRRGPFSGGDCTLTISSIRELPEHSPVESDLIAAREAAERADQAKSRFLATASHDMRQPLQALSLLNGTLRRLCDEPTVAGLLLQQEQSITGMSRLVNALLDISRLEAGAIKPEIGEFPLAPLFEELQRDFASVAVEKGLSLEVEFSPAIARSDRALLGQVLRNLISNAIKYTRRGRVLVRCLLAAQIVRLEVLDTGIGIPAELLPRIYDEFFQVGNAANSVRDGYGLGLSIVNRIVKLLGLRLDVSSVPGKGSSFCLDVPAGTHELSAAGNASGTELHGMTPRAASCPQVLLVEDDAGVRDATRMLLMAEGYQVVTAASYAEALTRSDAQPRIDLLITDYHLSGATGMEVISSLRAKRGASLNAILVSGDTSNRVQGLGHDAGLRIVKKPIQAEQFLAVINELLAAGMSVPPAAVTS
jgi:signal transduction histidine kinase/ActR/RegA family two-component response regulator